MHSNIENIKGIGPKKALILKSEASIETIDDFLYYMPRKYIDRSSFKLIKDCVVNEIVTIAGNITSVNITGSTKKRLEVKIDDGSDSLYGIYFGGFQYFSKIFAKNDFVIFSGKINFYGKKQIIHPEFDFIDINFKSKFLNTGRIIPLYRSTDKLKKIGFDSRGFRRTIKYIIENYINKIDETIDDKILNNNNLIGLHEAISGIHFPENFQHAENSRKRLAFNEIFFLQYYLKLSRIILHKSYSKNKFNINTDKYEFLLKQIPFELTPDQKKTINQIIVDIKNPLPMNRLLQGDVGSGKTIVAIVASYLTITANRQVAVMAPTEVLASQHFQNFCQFLTEGINVKLLTSSTSNIDKQKIYQSLANGQIDIVIGTHALIQDAVSFKELGLIIIDEQHRFGVQQRANLRDKGNNTDLLVMTATPIPRSLSLTLYGDLDISTIKTKPKNRIPIKTLVLSESKLNGVYKSIDKYIKQKRQIYYILPLVEESEKMDLKSAVQVYEKLKKLIFPQYNIALIHGRMKQTQKDEIMSAFKNGEFDILVSTTVIEVGIDVPNANVIVIEHAERFGLSQLHQLRGRVGRGEFQSFCALIHSKNISDEARTRLKILESTDDGFEISEKDLKLRGAGEFIGNKQSGHDGFEFINLLSDINLIIKAEQEAKNKIEEIINIDNILEKLKEKKYNEIFKGIRTKRILSILS